MLSFNLNKEVVANYQGVLVEFGFNGLGEVTYKRSYSRLQPEGSKEEWIDTCQRVVEGTYSIQKDYVNSHNLGWNESIGQRSASEMLNRIVEMKFLPPGRGLWSMGSPVVHEKKLSAALFNCGFVSTKNLRRDSTKPFEWLMDMSMLGVGVGFDVLGADKIELHDTSTNTFPYVIKDSREGWVDSLKVQLRAYFNGEKTPVFDYSEIRPAGQIIKTFGGISSGSDPLKKMHESIDKVLANREYERLTTTDIVDIMNIIGVCVVSGGIRRTAEIALGDMSDEEYVSLKDYDKNPHRMEYGWASNNTVLSYVGNDFTKTAEQAATNGEPGWYFIDNARKYGRLCDPADNKDSRVVGINPCGEITLESFELCNIVETFPAKHDSVDDYLRTLKYAYLYAKTVTLMPSHWTDTSKVQLRNRRIGISMSGITQAIEKFGIEGFRQMCIKGYEELKRLDKIYSEWLCIPQSVKLTTVKPSGTVSLLAGATPGIHYPESPYYIRRIRINKQQTDVIEPLREAGYKMYDAPENPKYDLVVEFPVDSKCSRSVSDVPIFEKFELVAFMQTWWADNAVSCTINFDPETEGHLIKHALDLYQYRAKSVSVLPTMSGAYQSPPYEAITEDEYHEMCASLNNVTIDIKTDAVVEKYCDGESCVF